MPRRIIDGEAMWGSDKLAACNDYVDVPIGTLYPWFYPLADANGSFELPAKWAAIPSKKGGHFLGKYPGNTPKIAALSGRFAHKCLSIFHEKGLLFMWRDKGKLYAHWTQSERQGLLPNVRNRDRYVRLAPPVPKRALSEYMSRFSYNCAEFGRSQYPESQRQNSGLGLCLGGKTAKRRTSEPIKNETTNGIDREWHELTPEEQRRWREEGVYVNPATGQRHQRSREPLTFPSNLLTEKRHEANR